MSPPIKHFVHQPGSPVLQESHETRVQEAVTDSPRCNIWWFLLIAGGIVGVWLTGLTSRYLDMCSQRDRAETRAEEQFKHILYRLDQIDKKLEGAPSSGKSARMSSLEAKKEDMTCR